MPQQYLLVYTLEHANETLEFARQMGNKLGLPIVQICNTRGLKGKSKDYVDYVLLDASPSQFVWLFNHARFIVTNTFHGNMFSVIFRKSFVHYDINGSDSRVTTLHTAIGLDQTRMIRTADALTESDINYALIETQICAFANKGIQFLKKNIEKNEKS